MGTASTRRITHPQPSLAGDAHCVAMNTISHDYGANRLLAAKRARKRAEGDYQLLSNRLVRLRFEEDKARKKIEETRKRAAEILALKARNQKAIQEKLQNAGTNDDELEDAKQRALDQRVASKVRCQQAKEAIVKKKRDDVLHVRKERQDHEIVVQRRKDADLEYARQCKDAIKAHELHVQQQAHQKRFEQTEKFQRIFDEKVVWEERERTLAEAEVRVMEQEEAFLIERLKDTQSEQRTAYDALEKALNYSVEEHFSEGPKE